MFVIQGRAAVATGKENANGAASPVHGRGGRMTDESTPDTESGPRQRRWRRTPWINGGLAVALAVAVVLAFTIIGNPSTPPVPVRTAVVTRGDVTATVTGSGNTASQLSIPVSFDTDGTVTAVNVKAGDTVTAGQVLATVDPVASREGLRTAQASLDGARAAYDQAAAGPTDVKKQQDQQAVTEAQQGVDNARTQLANDKDSTATSVKTARVQLSTDTTAQNTAVSQARTNANAACSGVVLEAFSAPLTTAPSAGASSTSASTTTRTSTPITTATSSTTSRTTTSTTTSAPTTSSTTATGGSTGAGASTSTSSSSSGSGSCTSAKQALTNAEENRTQVLDKDRLAITSAEQGQTGTLDKDQQAIVTAQGQLRDAQLAAEADLHPETPAQIAQARSNVDSAQVQVDTAQRALDGTVLKAPVGGVVLAVNGKVGESSGNTSSATGSSGSQTSGGTSSSTSSAATSSATSAGNGFVTIANPSQLEVTANIAEADAAGLQLGQEATVTFPATNDTATGTVTQITPQSTVTNNVVLYPITVSLDSAPPGVKTGSTASLSITDGQATGVLEVPTAAITTVGTNHTVTVQRGGSDTVVPVGVGLTGATTTEITSGLQAGDVVVLPSPTPATAPTAGAGFPRLGGGR
jgi:HlyD family secretion protein